jgi:RES domain-containing protein
MQVFRISNCKYIADTTGQGAYLVGGRWNSKGQRMLYTATNASLALLETLAHIPPQMPLLNYCLLQMQIPETSITIITASMLPKDWQVMPSTDTLKNMGDLFLQQNKYLALQVPSSVMPLENNILLNPNHKLFSKIKIINQQKIEIDKRLIK